MGDSPQSGTETLIKGILVTVICDYCHGDRRIPGGKYQKEYGEVIDCPCCGGSGKRTKEISLLEFARVFKGYL